MHTGSSKSPESRVWRDLYKAALFEHDERKFPERIADAEKALVQRARELFHNGGDNIKEQHALTMPCTPYTPSGTNLSSTPIKPDRVARQLRVTWSDRT